MSINKIRHFGFDLVIINEISINKIVNNIIINVWESKKKLNFLISLEIKILRKVTTKNLEEKLQY